MAALRGVIDFFGGSPRLMGLGARGSPPRASPQSKGAARTIALIFDLRHRTCDDDRGTFGVIPINLSRRRSPA